MRLERSHTQGYVSSLLNINQMNLSSWELNQKFPHPKHLENIINYLRYIPDIKLKLERIGMRTKLFRLKHQLSLEDFLQMTNIDIHVLDRVENMRFCKLQRNVLKDLEESIKYKPTFSFEDLE